MPIPHIIHFTTPGNPSDKQISAINKARELHPGWSVKVWSDPIPEDTFELSKYWKYVNSGAQLADLVRIEVVCIYGGIYLDSDVLLRKPLHDLADTFDFFIASEDGDVATNAVFGAVQGHPVLQQMIADISAMPPDWGIPPNITTGPVMFSNAIKRRQDVTILPRESFYPYNWNERPTQPHPATYGIHLWENSWKHDESGKMNPAVLIKSIFLPVKYLKTLLRQLHRRLSFDERIINLTARRNTTYPTSGKLVSSTVHGHDIVLLGEDLSITPDVVKKGYYELREQLFVKRVLRGGDCFIDVGSNVGTFSLLAASIVGPFGRVYAFEPNPLVAELVTQSIIMNDFQDRLIINCSAVSSRPGEARLRFNRQRMGNATLECAHKTRGATDMDECSGRSETIVAPVLTLDDEFACDIPIKFLKVDTGGCESLILNGASRLLSSQCVDYIMLDIDRHAAGDSWAALVSTIETVCSYGYQPYTLKRRGRPVKVDMNHVKAGASMRTRNLILISQHADSMYWEKGCNSG